MRKGIPIAGTLTALFLGGIYLARKKKVKIQFDKDKACENVRSLDLLQSYTTEFGRKYETEKEVISFDKKNFPARITYNWDAFAALVAAAANVEKIRIDFGINKCGNLVLCVFPANGEGEIIPVELVKGCRDPKEQIISDQPAEVNTGIAIRSLAAQAALASNPQGLDDGQRTP